MKHATMISPWLQAEKKRLKEINQIKNQLLKLCRHKSRAAYFSPTTSVNTQLTPVMQRQQKVSVMNDDKSSPMTTKTIQEWDTVTFCHDHVSQA
jgi:hypothetical protein